MESQTPVLVHAARTDRTRIRRFFAGFELAQPPPGVRLTYRALWFLDSIPIVAGALLLIGLLQLLRPVAGASARSEDRERSRSAIRRWGHNPVAWLSLQDGVHRFWPDAQSCRFASSSPPARGPG